MRIVVETVSICPGTDDNGDGLCRDQIAGGCSCCWWDMTVLEAEDDGTQWGDEDAVRTCQCGIAWIAVRCDTCRATVEKYEKGAADHDAAGEDRS